MKPAGSFADTLALLWPESEKPLTYRCIHRFNMVWFVPLLEGGNERPPTCMDAHSILLNLNIPEQPADM